MDVSRLCFFWFDTDELFLEYCEFPPCKLFQPSHLIFFSGLIINNLQVFKINQSASSYFASETYRLSISSSLFALLRL